MVMLRRAHANRPKYMMYSRDVIGPELAEGKTPDEIERLAAIDPDVADLLRSGLLARYTIVNNDPPVLWRPTSAGLCVLLREAA